MAEEAPGWLEMLFRLPVQIRSTLCTQNGSLLHVRWGDDVAEIHFALQKVSSGSSGEIYKAFNFSLRQ